MSFLSDHRKIKKKQKFQFHSLSFGCFRHKYPYSIMGNLLSRIFNQRKASDHSKSVFNDVSDLKLVTRDIEEGWTDLHVVNRKVGDARTVALESSKRVPVYKRLLEQVKRRDDRLSSLELEVELTEEKICELRKESTETKQELKEDLYNLFSPLTEEDEEEVCDALYGRDRGTVLVIHEPSNIEITKQIIQCLRSGGWLNDEVINLYLELLKEREFREPSRFLNCHFFNSFFYKKLISGNNGYDYKSVRRWTTHKKLGYSLIECDKIFVPVHKGTHWCLAIINLKDKSFLYLDSLGKMDFTVLRVLANYIMDEVKDKSGMEIDTSYWEQGTINGLPLQKNGYDCGMFMLKYIDFQSRGLKFSFGQEHMEYFRMRTAKEILRLRAE